MGRQDPDLPALRMQLATGAAASTTLPERAHNVLDVLGRIMPFDAGWLAVRDPEKRRHTPVATAGPAEPLRRYFRTPDAGFLSLLTEDPRRPDPMDQRIVAAITRVIAEELDRIREISETAEIVEAATAGVVLSRSGHTFPLPGLPDHRLLTRDSPILTAAVHELADASAYASFLAPIPGSESGALVRVTAVDCAVPDLDDLSAAVFLSPPGNLRGLGMLELSVLGRLIDGTTSVPAIAAALGVDATRVADAVGAALVALSAPDLTAAAVRALRTGLQIPPQLAIAGPALTA